MGEINDGLELGCKPLNLDNWSVDVNEDVVEKVEQMLHKKPRSVIG